MLEWVAGFAMGLCVGVVPTAFALGAMHQQNMSAKNRAEVVREFHKALVDVGGRVSTWMKGTGQNESKLGQAGHVADRASGAWGGDCLADQGPQENTARRRPASNRAKRAD